MAKPIELNSQVMMSKKWLRNIHASATDPLWRAKGTVVGLEKLGKTAVAIVRWQDGDTYGVLVNNLARTADLARLNLPD